MGPVREPQWTTPPVFADMNTGINRSELRSELVTLYYQYRDGAEDAASARERYERLSESMHSILNEVFPDWEKQEDALSERASQMVTLYYRYSEDASQAAEIMQRFARLTRDIEIILSEEFPGWRSEDYTTERAS